MSFFPVYSEYLHILLYKNIVAADCIWLIDSAYITWIFLYLQQGNTAAHLAAINNHPDVLRQLIDAYAELNITNNVRLHLIKNYNSVRLHTTCDYATRLNPSIYVYNAKGEKREGWDGSVFI